MYCIAVRLRNQHLASDGAADWTSKDDPGEGRAHRDVAAARCSLSSTPAPTDDTSQAMDDDATRASRDDTPQWQQRGNSAWEMVSPNPVKLDKL